MSDLIEKVKQQPRRSSGGQGRNVEISDNDRMELALMWMKDEVLLISIQEALQTGRRGVYSDLALGLRHAYRKRRIYERRK